MKALLLLLPILLLNACVGPRGFAPSTVEATRSIQSARVGTVRAQAAAAKTIGSIKTATDAVEVLQRTATGEQIPAITTIKDSLKVARLEIREAETQLLAVSYWLAASDGQLRRLQAEVDMQTAKLTVAERRAAAYHRLKFWLAAAAAGFAFYAAMRIVPPLGPYKWWIAGGAAATAGGVAFYII